MKANGLEDKMENKFEKERRLLILLSRVTFSEKDIDEIKKLTQDKISWCEVFKYALHNKVVNLVWGNVVKLNIRHIPKYIKQIMNYSLYGQTEQNKIYMREKNQILKVLEEKGVIAIPVKGAMLVDYIYGSYGIRTLGDLDFLISKRDDTLIDQCLKEIGYQKGTFDAIAKTIIPLDRKEDIKWKVGATNIFPYLKVINNGIMDFVKVDFRHSLDETLNKEPIENILEYYKINGKVNASHIILHLAAHMYHEATHSMSLLYNKDINLIKFCDIREYILKSMDNMNFNELISIAKKYSLEECVYYTFYYLKEIYSDGYEEKVLSKMPDKDISLIDRCYDSKQKKYFGWKKNFFDRMFASDNFDELENVHYEENKTF